MTTKPTTGADEQAHRAFEDVELTESPFTGNVDPDAFDMDYRTHFEKVYAKSDRGYEDYIPAYRYGHKAAVDPRYRGRGWDAVESALRAGWEKAYPGRAWDHFTDAIRRGWEKLTGEPGN